MGVEVGSRHGKGFVVDESVAVAIEHGVDAEGEDVLVVSGEHAWVDDCSPWDFDAVVDRLGAENASGAYFVRPFAGLVEHESQDVLVVGDSYSVIVSLWSSVAMAF